MVVAFGGDELAQWDGDEGGEGVGYWLEVRAEDGEGLVELGGHFCLVESFFWGGLTWSWVGCLTWEGVGTLCWYCERDRCQVILCPSRQGTVPTVLRRNATTK